MRKLTAVMLLFTLAASCGMAEDRPGTVRITNRDSGEHSVEIERNQRIIQVFPGPASQPNAVTIPAGGLAATELAAGPWNVYGDGNHRFTIMVTAGQDYDFTLQPFSQTGPYGDVAYGLLGMFDDGYNQSSYQLFALDEAPPSIVVQPAPAPPVVVVPSPSYYYPPPYHRDRGRDLGEAIGSAVFDILGEVLSDDHHRRRRHR